MFYELKDLLISATRSNGDVILGLWRQWMAGELNAAEFEIESTRVVRIEALCPGPGVGPGDSLQAHYETGGCS